MDYLKKNFVILSIERQIQLGVISVTCCIAFLVIVLTIVNGLILLNLHYIDFLSTLDNIENDAIENMSFFFENEMNLILDMEKTQIQIYRNFLENINQDRLLIPFKNTNYENYFIEKPDPMVYGKEAEVCKVDNCFLYYWIPTENTRDRQGLINLRKSLYLSIPLLNTIINSIGLLHKINSKHLKLVESMNFLSKYLNISIQYPHTSHLNSYILDVNKIDNNLSELILRMVNNMKDVGYEYYNLQNNIIEKENFLRDPKIDAGYLKINNNLVQNLNSYSVKFYNSLNISDIESFRAAKNVENIIFMNWGTDMIEQNIYEQVIVFDGTQSIITSKEHGKIMNYMSCLYFIKLYSIYNKDFAFNPKTYNLSKIKNITDCFIYEDAKIKINQFFDYGNSSKTMKYSRKASINLINITSSTYLSYKVYKVPQPSIYSSSMLPMKFFSVSDTFVYIFRNEQYNFSKNETLFLEILKQVLVLSAIIFSVWYLLLLLIIYLLRRVTSVIIGPINALIDKMSFLGDNSKIEIKENDQVFENIKCDFDTDINDLLNICKSLIKGGFDKGLLKDEELKSKKLDKFLSGAYNNISHIKTNNLIIQEELIEKTTKNEISSFIFDFNEKDEEKKFKELLGNYNSENNDGLQSLNNDNLSNNDSYLNYLGIKNLRSKKTKNLNKKSVFKKDKGEAPDIEENREKVKEEVLSIVGNVFSRNKNYLKSYIQTLDVFKIPKKDYDVL